MAQLPNLEERTLLRSFERALDFAPDKVALADRDASSTYAQAFQRSLSLARGLARLGCRPGSPAGLMLDNSLDFVHAWLGMGLTGTVEVPVNTAYKGDFLAHILRDSGVETLLVEAHYLDRVEAIADQVPSLKNVVVRGAFEGKSPAGLNLVAWGEVEGSAPATPVRRDPSDLFAFMYTSGTTGLSKGVLIPEAQAYTYASREDQDLPTHQDRILVALPLFHLAGQWYGVYQSLIHRASCVVEPGFSPSVYWDVVRRQGITVTVMLGAMAEMLQQQPAGPEDLDNPLRLAVMAPLASDFGAFERRFGLKVAAVYGMSEIGAVMNGPPGTVVGGEAGFARDGYELRLVGADGHDAPDGEVGELWVRPMVPHTVMAGYHNLPEATAAATQGGVDPYGRRLPARCPRALLLHRPHEGRPAQARGERLELRGGKGSEFPPVGPGERGGGRSLGAGRRRDQGGDRVEARLRRRSGRDHRAPDRAPSLFHGPSLHRLRAGVAQDADPEGAEEPTAQPGRCR